MCVVYYPYFLLTIYAYIHALRWIELDVPKINKVRMCVGFALTTDNTITKNYMQAQLAK